MHASKTVYVAKMTLNLVINSLIPWHFQLLFTQRTASQRVREYIPVDAFEGRCLSAFALKKDEESQGAK